MTQPLAGLAKAADRASRLDVDARLPTRGSGFQVNSAVFTRLGFDVGALVTTSAIIGAVAGLAMQPTLWWLFCGVPIVVEELHWRHIVARRFDALRVVIPNALLAAETFKIISELDPCRVDVRIHLSSDVPPQVVTDLLTDAYSDVEHGHVTRRSGRPGRDTTPGGRYHVPHPGLGQILSYQGRARGEILRCARYTLDRGGIRPANLRYSTPTTRRGEDLLRLMPEALPNLDADGLDLALAESRISRFSPSELLRRPHDDRGRRLVIVKGEVPVDWTFLWVHSAMAAPSSRICSSYRWNTSDPAPG